MIRRTTMSNLQNLPRVHAYEKSPAVIARVYVEVRQVRQPGASHVR